jgi:SagB-type dehydrogenase family enzyme
MPKKTDLGARRRRTAAPGEKTEQSESAEPRRPEGPIALPPPDLLGKRTFESVLEGRRTVREFHSGPLAIEEIAQILWAAQGETDEEGGRTAPSAGGTFPIVIYLVAGEVESLPAGVYLYVPATHALAALRTEDLREELAAASLNQDWVAEAPASVILCANYDRSTNRYGERGTHYVEMEAGHVAQNVHLQAVAIGLGSAPVGAFLDRAVQELLALPEEEEPLYIIPFGKPR